jgi:hypothetical protein
MTWDVFMYGAGWTCLGAIAIIATVIFAEDLYHRWPQIMTAFRGNDERGFVPLSPTASVLSLRTRHTPLRAVEADVQPTRTVAR